MSVDCPLNLFFLNSVWGENKVYIEDYGDSQLFGSSILSVATHLWN